MPTLGYYNGSGGDVVQLELTNEELASIRQLLDTKPLGIIRREFGERIIAELATARSGQGNVQNRYSPQIAELQNKAQSADLEAERHFREANQLKASNQSFKAMEAEANGQDARSRANQLRGQLEQLEMSFSASSEQTDRVAFQRLEVILGELKKIEFVVMHDGQSVTNQLSERINQRRPEEQPRSGYNVVAFLKGMYPAGVPDEIAWRHGVDPAQLRQQSGPANRFSPTGYH